MSYLALYRKWRPKTFEEVKGQDAICTTLKNQIMSGRIGHAYLFCGTRGTGKTSVAKILARAVNCENPENGNPCNKCATCASILKENSMNVVEIDAASNNGVENIRDIREQVQYPPTEGKYRVFIIDEVHMLSTGAFNALLKTLEEPPEYVIFILATTEVSKIPITVLSRCQRYDFRRISVETIAAHLKELTASENIKMDEKALTYIARCADGAMRDALSLLDECVAFHPEGEISYDQVLEILGAADIGTFRKLFGAASKADTGEALRVIGDAVAQGREMNQFVSDFLWYLRNLLIIKTSEDPEGIIDTSRENMKLMQDDAALVSKESLMRSIRVFAELSNRMRYSPQKRVMTELAIIKLTSPQMEENNDALLERIASLEREMRDLKERGIQIGTGKAASGKGTEAGPGGKEETQTGSQTIRLPKAEYDDFMTVRKEWGKIAASQEGLYEAVLKDTMVEPKGSGSMCIVFPNASVARYGERAELLTALSAYVAEHYQKEITFSTRIRKNGNEPANNYVVSEEEMQAAVNFPIEKVSDKEDQ